MKFRILYEKRVLKHDIPRISQTDKERIQNDIEKKLTTYPEVFAKPLRKSLKGYRSLRSGDYRIVFRIEKNTVKIFLIQHRSVVYKKDVKHL